MQALDQQGYLENYAPSTNDQGKNLVGGTFNNRETRPSFIKFMEQDCENVKGCYYLSITKDKGFQSFKTSDITHFCESPGSLIIQKDNPAYFNDKCSAHFSNNTGILANTWIPSVEYTKVDDISKCSDKCSENGYYSWNNDLKQCGILNQTVESNNATFCTLSGYTTYSKKWEFGNCKPIAGM